MELDIDVEPDLDVKLDIDVEDGAVFGIVSHRPLSLQHNVLPPVCYLAFMLQSKAIRLRDLQQDVVEKKGAEHATQLLALIHHPVTLPQFETWPSSPA